MSSTSGVSTLPYWGNQIQWSLPSQPQYEAACMHEGLTKMYNKRQLGMCMGQASTCEPQAAALARWCSLHVLHADTPPSRTAAASPSRSSHAHCAHLHTHHGLSQAVHTPESVMHAGKLGCNCPSP